MVPYPEYVLLEMELRAFCMPDKHSSSRATSPDPLTRFFKETILRGPEVLTIKPSGKCRRGTQERSHKERDQGSQRRVEVFQYLLFKPFILVLLQTQPGFSKVEWVQLWLDELV